MRYKYFISLKIVFITLAFVSILKLEGFALEWKELSGDHFLIYYTGEEKFAKDVSDKAEVYYRKIATDLGYPRYSEFWTWDNRVKIYIYPDRPSYLSASGQPTWSEGMADYKAKQIISYAWSKGFVESLLPHEMAHLIFRDFVGFKGQVPLWLDEGVAQWAEEPKRRQIKALAKQNFENDYVLSLSDMMRVDIRNLNTADRLYIRTTRTKGGERGVLFLSAENLVSLYYLQSVSLVGFLIEKYGSLTFADFCRQLRDGKSLEEALRFSYPEHFRSIDELETEWRQYLEKSE